MTAKFNNFMQLALIQAELAYNAGEVPVGAIIVDNATNQVIASGFNCNINLKDSTAHAEIIAIRAACLFKNHHRLDNCDLYVTLEPCPMCASAISQARIKRLYYGASDPKSGGVEDGAKIFSHATCHHKPEIYAGIGEAESSLLLKKFFLQKR